MCHLILGLTYEVYLSNSVVSKLIFIHFTLLRTAHFLKNESELYFLNYFNMPCDSHNIVTLNANELGNVYFSYQKKFFVTDFLSDFYLFSFHFIEIV